MKDEFVEYVKGLQDQITARMHEIDPDLKMTEDLWDRQDALGKPGGGGRTRHFQGSVFESAGVNFSCVYGTMEKEFAKVMKGDGNEFWASGISLILHPINPRIPTVHANFRMIQMGEKQWFGGGSDLTPYYPHEKDFIHFHKTQLDVCKPFDCYEAMKKRCDEYFVNHHRDGEMRGIGGIFFDHLNSGNLKQDFDQVVALSKGFIPSYFPIVERRMNEEFTQEDEDFMLHRRGRYVEFNLVHDRGTLFGLKTKGRIDSILISLPPRVKFSYCYQPPKGSAHEEMMQYYQPRDYFHGG